jgi:hypothetical protein
LADLPNWRQCFLVKDALTRAVSRRFPHFPYRGNGASTRCLGSARALTPSSTAPFPMKRILKCIHGILPRRFAVHPAVTPPSRPAQRVGIYTWQLRMVPSQVERRNAKHSLAHPANALNVRTACMFSEKPKIRECIRRLTEPHVCVPPGDAAISACQARVRDAL